MRHINPRYTEMPYCNLYEERVRPICFSFSFLPPTSFCGIFLFCFLSWLHNVGLVLGRSGHSLDFIMILKFERWFVCIRIAYFIFICALE
jgi:hypothetical protein